MEIAIDMAYNTHYITIFNNKLHRMQIILSLPVMYVTRKTANLCDLVRDLLKNRVKDKTPGTD